MTMERLRGVSLERWATWAALASVAAFLFWSAIRIRDIAAPMYQNSDIASAPVMAELFGDRGSGAVTLGYYPWLEGLLPLHWTRWLPDHVSAWKAIPFLIYGGTVVLVGWTGMRAISKRAGLLLALAMATPAPLVIYMLGVPSQRLPALAHAVVLAAFLVTVPSLAGWGPPKRALWAVGLALTLAPGVASDPLLVAGAVVPFLAAVALGWRLGLMRLAVATWAAGACVAGALAGRIMLKLAEDDRIVYVEGVFGMADSGRALSNAGLLLENLALFAHGQFAAGDAPIDAFNTGRELVAVAAIVAVVLFVIAAARAAPSVLTDPGRSPSQRLLAIYWAVSILAVAAAFITTTAAVSTNSVRYVTTLWPALLTLAAILYGRRALTGLAILATGTALVGCVELARGWYTPGAGPPPDETESELVGRFVAANDLDHGYASYWDAMPITLQSEFEALTYPIEPCGPSPDGYCPFRLHTIESWYEPEAGARSFYVVGDPSLVPSLGPPPRDWGRPIETARLGDLTIYAYDYDIAARIQPLEPGEIGPPRPEAAR